MHILVHIYMFVASAQKRDARYSDSIEYVQGTYGISSICARKYACTSVCRTHADEHDQLLDLMHACTYINVRACRHACTPIRPDTIRTIIYCRCCARTDVRTHTQAVRLRIQQSAACSRPRKSGSAASMTSMHAQPGPAGR